MYCTNIWCFIWFHFEYSRFLYFASLFRYVVFVCFFHGKKSTICIYMYLCIYVCIYHIHIYLYINICIIFCICSYNLYKYVYAHTYTYIYVHMCMYTYLICVVACMLVYRYIWFIYCITNISFKNLFCLDSHSTYYIHFSCFASIYTDYIFARVRLCFLLLV